jgi:ribosome maturation factor RimP
MNETELERILEDRIADLGFEFVELERTGSRTRPVLRIRIDRPESAPGHGVTVDDCAAVSRALESVLDNEPKVAERYILEVSSPGIERPLVRLRDYQRFAGKEIALRSRVPLEGLGKRIEGTLLGLTGEGPDSRIKLALEGGRTVDIPHADVVRAHLVFRWDEGR